MYYVYVLKSKKSSHLYIGYTDDLKRRFIEHTRGGSLATKRDRPFALVYYEVYYSKKDAHNREKRLKSFKKGYRLLKERTSYSLIES